MAVGLVFAQLCGRLRGCAFASKRWMARRDLRRKRVCVNVMDVEELEVNVGDFGGDRNLWNSVFTMPT